MPALDKPLTGSRPTPTDTVAEQRLWRLIKGIKFAMFTVDHGKGHLHLRPTMTQNKTMLDDELRFHAAVKGDSVQELTQRPEPRVVDHMGYVNGTPCALDARLGSQRATTLVRKTYP